MSTAARKSFRTKDVAEEAATEPAIDTKLGVIRNVLVLGKRARNKRRYTEEAMEEAVHSGKYEHLQVYIGPHKKTRFAKRSPHDHAGELRDTYVAADGIRGDLWYNRASKGGKLVLEIAQRFPKRFGLSHHADVAGYIENGEKIITRIVEVTVADVIKDPATTDNVFEDVETPKSGKKVRETATEDEELGTTETDTDPVTSGGWAQCLKDLVGELHDDDSIDDDLKMKATKQLLKIKKMLNGDDSEDEEEEEEDAEEETEPKKGATESVNIARLVKRAVAQAFKSQPRQVLPPRKPTNKPRSSARTEATEDVTPTPAKKPTPLPALKKREDIIDAYSE